MITTSSDCAREGGWDLKGTKDLKRGKTKDRFDNNLFGVVYKELGWDDYSDKFYVEWLMGRGSRKKIATSVIVMAPSENTPAPSRQLIRQDNDRDPDMFDYPDEIDPRLYGRVLGYSVNQLDSALKGKTKSLSCAVVDQDLLKQINALGDSVSVAYAGN